MADNIIMMEWKESYDLCWVEAEEFLCLGHQSFINDIAQP